MPTPNAPQRRNLSKNRRRKDPPRPADAGCRRRDMRRGRTARSRHNNET
jgi:hypothetical protein